MLIPTGAAERYQLSAERVRDAWVPGRTRGVLLASPSNPTGTSIDPQELQRIHALVQARGGITVVDEIYLGLGFDAHFGHSALALGDDIVSINSFSKYFSMTGWRLGWLVVPEALVPVGGEAAALSRAVSSDFNRYGKIIKETGIQAD